QQRSRYPSKTPFKGRKNQNCLLTMDDGVVNWGEHTVKEKETNHALMAIITNNKVSLCSKTCIDLYYKLKTLCDEQTNQLGEQEAKILAFDQAVKKLEAQVVTFQKKQSSLNEQLTFQANELYEEDEKLKKYRRIGLKTVKEKEQLQKTVDSWKNSSKNLWKLVDSGMSSTSKVGLGYEIKSNDEVLSYEEEMNRTVFNCTEEDFVDKPLYSRFSKTDNFKGVPHPLTGDYTPQPQQEIDDSLYVYGKKGPQKPKTSVSDDKFSENSVTSNEEVVSAPKPKEAEPSCVTHVKIPKQPMKNQGTPKVNGKNWNEMMERKLGEEAELKKQRVFNTGNVEKYQLHLDELAFRECMEEQAREQEKIDAGQEGFDKERREEREWEEKQDYFNPTNFREDSIEEAPFNQEYVETSETIDVSAMVEDLSAPAVDKGKGKESVKDQASAPKKKRGRPPSHVDGIRIYHKNHGRSERIANMKKNTAFQFDKHGTGFELGLYYVWVKSVDNNMWYLQDPTHPHVAEERPMTVDDLLQLVPKLITKVDSLEKELKQTKLTMGKAIVKLVKKSKRTKKQIREEQTSLAEIVRLQAQEEAENARKAEQQRHDALIAKRVQDELELFETQKNRMAQVQEAAKYYTEEDWDSVRAKLEANKDLSSKVLSIDFPSDDFAKKIVEEFDKSVGAANVFKKQKITDVPDVTKDESVKREEEFKVQQPILRYNIRKSLARKGLKENKSQSERSDTK
ncbi:hypothetical protein Tco_0802998, partial [Tanacetum coccineum]